jgi:trans-aconitate 2-methyltransferase
LEQRKHYASPEATRSRLEAAGFIDVETWLHEEPTPLPADDLEPYLEAICLGDHVEGLATEERRQLVHEVARRMPGPVIDYVRLNIRARRAG